MYKNLLQSILLVLCLTTSLFITGCDRSIPTPHTPAEHTYIVKGTIVKLPPADAAQKEMTVRHETITGYVMADGSKEDMPGMTMPFPLAESVTTGELKEGDLVEFTYEVRWNTEPHHIVTSIKKLS